MTRWHIVPVCLHQLYPPHSPTPWEQRMYGWGDCLNCSNDEQNVNCEGYHPAPIYVIERESAERSLEKRIREREGRL